MAGTAEVFFEDMHGSPNHLYLGYSHIGMRTERMSEVDWQNVDMGLRLGPDCYLRNPIITAAMNCISEDDMGIGAAKVGGAAIIHHANTPEEQKTLVENVYHHLAGIIEKPLSTSKDNTLHTILEELDNRKKGFRTLPVVDENNRCVGLLDKELFQLFGPETRAEDAMRELGSFTVAEAGVTPNNVYARMRAEKTGKIVLLDRERRIGGLCLVKDIKRVVDSNPDEYSLDANGRLIVFASVPTIEGEAVERVGLLKKYVKAFKIDTSHGEHKYAVRTMKAIQQAHPEVLIISGNISTEETAEEIAKLEPAMACAGQGPGEICISSDRLGYGTPQASAVYEVAKGVRKINPKIPVIADGGIRDSADTVKAFGIGARAVVVGSLVAGTDETPERTFDRDPETGVAFRWYWGMGSRRAQEAFAAARARYGHIGEAPKTIFAEGFEKKVALKGPVGPVIEEHVMGVKMSMGAQGMNNVVELRQHAQFMRGTNTKAA